MPLSNTTDLPAVERIAAGTKSGANAAATLAAVADALARLRYGAVHLTVHDGRVVQLDVTERQRFT
jgi:hypothetical protein